MDSKKAHMSWNGSQPGEEIVISGIAGRFPKSDNMHQLRKNLFDKVDLTTDHDRWKMGK
jgi:fatty acid synthase